MNLDARQISQEMKLLAYEVILRAFLDLKYHPTTYEFINAKRFINSSLFDAWVRFGDLEIPVKKIKDFVIENYFDDYSEATTYVLGMELEEK